jgi:hypothetical protein
MKRLVWVSIFIGLIIAGRVTAQRPAKSGDGSRGISGRVLNHNGQPLAGGKVFMEKVGGGPSDSRETFINDAGEFRFDNLSPGVYTLFTPGAMDEDQQQKYQRPGDFVTLRVKKGGVITGTVTDSTGEPLIGARVHTIRVRGEHGRRIHQAGRFSLWQGERSTDDRGVYRFWGLPPGSYLVSVGGKDTRSWNRIPDAIEEEAPTYHPSSATPEAATEVIVNEGREATGIDIRHRGESGYAISGHISGQVPSGSQQEAVIVTLTQTSTGALVGSQGIRATDGSNSFVLEGVADGEYDLTAQQIIIPNVNTGSVDINAASPHRRVIVKGKDVIGLEMKLVPLGSIEGRVVLEADRKPRCQNERITRLDEMVFIFGSERADPPLPIFTSLTSDVRGALVVPDQRGDFTIRSLKAAQYRVEGQLPSEDWYIRSINLSGPTQARPIDGGRDGITVKSGQHVTGLTISIQEGAASLRGRVVTAQVSATLPARLLIHLVPAEREQSDNVLRFAEAAVQRDGSFGFTNIAPGRYWLLARPGDDLRTDSNRPLAWDGEARTKLIREAIAANNPIELQPCQRLGGHMLRYTPPETTDPKKM